MSLDIQALTDRVRTPGKADRLLVPPTLTQGDFDSLGVDAPFPFFHDGRYRMTYIGFDGVGYRTGIASSEDLVTWRKDGILIDRGAAGSTTEFNVALTWILRENDLFSRGELRRHEGRYLGTYHAYPKPGYESGPAVIGLCTSDDLTSWTLHEPCLNADDGAEWEAGGLYKSCLLEHEGTFYLFYNAKTADSPRTEQTGVATSKDLVNWRRHAGNPVVKVGPKGSFDDRFCSDPCVLRMGDVWAMFFFTLSTDGYARESVAFSEDLLHWEKSGEILLDVGPAGAIDSRYAHKPGVVSDGTRLYHFYCAVAPIDEISVGRFSTREMRGISSATGPVAR